MTDCDFQFHVDSAIVATAPERSPGLVPLQVYLNYGSHDNTHLLVFYGFVIAANPNDSIAVSLKVGHEPVHHHRQSMACQAPCHDAHA